MLGGINRHKTAISRSGFSRPIKLAIADGLLAPNRAFFDYGCGLGDDLRLLAGIGIHGIGWDPVHRPNQEPRSAPVVNLGYVVNVIEDPDERQDALRLAWSLAEEVLIVSARTSIDGRFLTDVQDYADGLLTSRGTFQKFFDQQELRTWIDQALQTPSVPAAPGVFYIFRDQEKRASFIASRFRRRLAAPHVSRSAELYRGHEELLRPLIDFVSDRGRLPADDELANTGDICAILGSVRRAFRVIAQVTNTVNWQEITQKRKEDTLIYLALSRFDGRPTFSHLPRALQQDVKAFFKTYKHACDKADEILFSLGRRGIIDIACSQSYLGKLTPSALYVHVSALEALAPVLRAYEGCARGYLGYVEGANIVKLHRGEPRISYLYYPAFEDEPHPALSTSLTVHLQTFRVKLVDFQSRINPPILHRKELFLASDHPLRAKFARLTELEEREGLYEDSTTIGTRDGWNEKLATKKLYLRGHRLLMRRTGLDATPPSSFSGHSQM